MAPRSLLIDGLKVVASQLIVLHHIVLYAPMADVLGLAGRPRLPDRRSALRRADLPGDRRLPCRAGPVAPHASPAAKPAAALPAPGADAGRGAAGGAGGQRAAAAGPLAGLGDTVADARPFLAHLLLLQDVLDIPVPVGRRLVRVHRLPAVCAAGDRRRGAAPPRRAAGVAQPAALGGGGADAGLAGLVQPRRRDSMPGRPTSSAPTAWACWPPGPAAHARWPGCSASSARRIWPARGGNRGRAWRSPA